jgi:ADP-heptose:LPS heptosyltransferase
LTHFLLCSSKQFAIKFEVQGRTPRLERNLDLVAALGLPVRPVPDAGIAIAPEDVAAAQAIVRPLSGGGAAYAVLNPGASRRQAYKKPPARLFAAAAHALAEQRICPPWPSLRMIR